MQLKYAVANNQKRILGVGDSNQTVLSRYYHSHFEQ